MNCRSFIITSVALCFGVAPLSSFAQNSASSTSTQLPSREQILSARRIVFLGDSITAGATYVIDFATVLRSQKLPHGGPEVLSVGLSSETVSGLSEESHPFPRPCVHERLTRALSALKADVIFACYGMNCGVYMPLDEERFAAFRAGMEKLHNETVASGARIVHITPPYFDPARKPTQAFYADVLLKYSEWLVSQRAQGWEVIDLHSAMREEALKRKALDPKFTFSNDAVHPGAEGHWLMAQQILAWLGDSAAAESPALEVLLQKRQFPIAAMKLIEQRVQLTKNSWVQAIGHNRPGVAKGLPLEEASAKAAELDAQLEALLK